ncbi:sulfatase-like hydrolase/transferase [Aurantiacibacter luteus]|nr:sulfatase-like hydrolase/transferase [Aurantiacibacter luteus]
MNRRRAIGTIGGLVGGAALPAGCRSIGEPSGATGKPNILWLVSEDNNPFIGAYGDRLARTPNIDALAREGILYRNVYSNAPVCAPSRFCLLTGIHPESAGPAHHMRAEATLPDFIRTYPDHLRSAGYYCTNNEKTDYNCRVEAGEIWDDSSATAHYRNRAAGQPFMAVFNTEITHESRLFGSTDGAVRPEDVRVPAYLPDSPEVRRDYASYYNLVERMDDFIGEHLRALEEAGLADDTIVFYYSDNGGCLPRSKRYCYDEGLRCALVVRVPDKWRHLAPVSPGLEIDAPVSFIDFVPTLLSLAGIAQPAELPGKPFLGQRIADPKTLAFGMRNRMDERYDFIRTVTDGRYRYIRNYMPHRPLGQPVAFAWMLGSYADWHARFLAGTLDEVQRRFFEAKPHEEFYDLESDPDEVVNLAERPGRAADALASMRAALDQHMLAINDNGFIPEGSWLEGYGASRVAGAYPLERIMGIAAMAAGGRQDDLGDLAALLGDEDPTVRYWAATGVLIRMPDAGGLGGALRLRLSKENDLHVRIVLAEALSHTALAADGVAELARIAGRETSEPIRLQALNALTFAPDPSPTLEMIDTLVNDTGYLGRAATYLARTIRGTFDPHISMLPPRR